MLCTYSFDTQKFEQWERIASYSIPSRNVSWFWLGQKF
jgi:hypothetical protein